MIFSGRACNAVRSPGPRPPHCVGRMATKKSWWSPRCFPSYSPTRYSIIGDFTISHWPASSYLVGGHRAIATLRLTHQFSFLWAQAWKESFTSAAAKPIGFAVSRSLFSLLPMIHQHRGLRSFRRIHRALTPEAETGERRSLYQ